MAQWRKTFSMLGGAQNVADPRFQEQLQLRDMALRELRQRQAQADRSMELDLARQAQASKDRFMQQQYDYTYGDEAAQIRRDRASEDLLSSRSSRENARMGADYSYGDRAQELRDLAEGRAAAGEGRAQRGFDLEYGHAQSAERRRAAQERRTDAEWGARMNRAETEADQADAMYDLDYRAKSRQDAFESNPRIIQARERAMLGKLKEESQAERRAIAEIARIEDDNERARALHEFELGRAQRIEGYEASVQRNREEQGIPRLKAGQEAAELRFGTEKRQAARDRRSEEAAMSRLQQEMLKSQVDARTEDKPVDPETRALSESSLWAAGEGPLDQIATGRNGRKLDLSMVKVNARRAMAESSILGREEVLAQVVQSMLLGGYSEADTRAVVDSLR